MFLLLLLSMDRFMAQIGKNAKNGNACIRSQTDIHFLTVGLLGMDNDFQSWFRMTFPIKTICPTWYE